MMDRACSLLAWLLQLRLSDAALSTQLAYDASKSTVQLDSLDSVFFFWGGGVLRLTKCILGPWQSSPKLFRIYNTMLGRERENADEISSCCSAKAICMTSLSWKSHSRARKWLPLRWNLSFQRPVGCEWEVRFLNLCLKPSDVTPWQKSLKG